MADGCSSLLKSARRLGRLLFSRLTDRSFNAAPTEFEIQAKLARDLQPLRIQKNCWDVQASAFLRAAKESGPQAAALYALALDAGPRKGELCGRRQLG